MQKELIFSALLILAFTACNGHSDRSANNAPVRVRTQLVTSQETVSASRYVATIQPLSETPVSIQTAGRVSHIYCKDGDRVRTGQLLLRIDTAQAASALQSAQASLHQAQDGYKRLKQVHDKGAVTDQKMVEIETRLAQAQSMYQIAQQQLKECTLYAPCDGVISGLDLQKGQTLAPGIRVLTILDISAYTAHFTVPENEVRAIQVGQEGLLECPAIADTLHVTVTEKGLKANPVAHTYQLTASIDGNTAALIPGMIGKVELSQCNQPEGSSNIVIPANCVLLKPQGPTVWVMEKGRAQRRNFKIAGYRAGGVQLLSGLNSGDTLIVDGYKKLYAGCPVEEVKE